MHHRIATRSLANINSSVELTWAVFCCTGLDFCRFFFWDKGLCMLWSCNKNWFPCSLDPCFDIEQCRFWHAMKASAHPFSLSPEWRREPLSMTWPSWGLLLLSSSFLSQNALPDIPDEHFSSFSLAGPCRWSTNTPAGITFNFTNICHSLVPLLSYLTCSPQQEMWGLVWTEPSAGDRVRDARMTNMESLGLFPAEFWA